MTPVRLIVFGKVGPLDRLIRLPRVWQVWHCAWCRPMAEVQKAWPGALITSGVCAEHSKALKEGD